MQHHGIPTRLIDFTEDAWMAVFFAVEDLDSTDGRLFAILVDDASHLPATPAGTPWRKYKTQEVKIWDPVASGVSFPRIAAQKGVFAVGRLPSTRPHREAIDNLVPGGKRSLLAEEVRRILSIPFKLCPFQKLPARAAPPIGFTFRIHVDKESVRRDLQGQGSGNRICPTTKKIAHGTVYPDAAGMSDHSFVLRRLRRGLLLP